MTQLTEVRTPQVIATEIHSIKGHARDVILRSSVEIGRRLVEAKAMLSHGEWGEWLDNSVDYSHSTANNLMAIYREYGDKITTLGNLSYTKALALLGVPEDEREQFVQDHDVDNLSAKELQKLVKEKQSLEQQLKKAEETAEQERQRVAALEAKTQDHEALVQQLSNQIEEAKRSGNDEEAQRLHEQLQASRSRIAELEAELSRKPVDVPGVVERIPEDVERELAELRKMAAQPSGEEAVRFRVCFDNLVRGFQDLLGSLDGVKGSDPAAYEKYKSAVAGLLGKMSERL